MSLLSRPLDAIGWTTRFFRLTTLSRTVADMAQALAPERQTGRRGVAHLGDAVRKCVESHLRDVELLLPWVRLSRKPLRLCSTVSPGRYWSGELSSRSFILFPRWRPYLNVSRRRSVRSTALRETRSAIRYRTGPRWQGSLCWLMPYGNRPRCRRSHPPSRGHRADAEQMVRAMDFTFLFDPTRKLLSIGYRMAENSLDPSCYDLLASEARLASFIAIAKGDVPASHWFHLGRALTPRVETVRR